MPNLIYILALFGVLIWDLVKSDGKFSPFTALVIILIAASFF